MTIQVKRGNGAGRPNPLLNGELGWDADGRRLWIGNGVVNENLFVAGAAVTTDFSVYVCTAALGGGAGDADGLAKNSGTATATSAGKLVDAAASFDSSYVGKTVYNVTDDTWAKITAVDSPTQLSLSADIMTVGNSYETTNAFATVPDGFAAVPGPYSANVTLRISPGTFPDGVTLIGKIAAGSKTLTVQGSTAGTTTIDGPVEISQKVAIKNITFSGTTINANYGAEITWADCPLVSTRLNTRNGSDLTWDNCGGSGTTKLYTYIGSKNLIQNTAITVGNNPENLVSINSTITKGYTIYVATTALGGNDAVADGLAITSGSATGTTANKLVDAAAKFTSALVGKTVWNSTDDTWAKVNAVDSATQLSLSADIMANGEPYVVADAFSTLQGVIDSIPGTVNADITVKVCNGTFTEDATIQGKGFSGNYSITLVGTLSLTATVTSAVVAAGSGSTPGTATKAGAFNPSYANKLVYFVTDGIFRLVDSATADALTLCGTADSSTTQTVKVYDWQTTLAGSSGAGLTLAPGQQSIIVEKLKFVSANAGYPNYTSLYLNSGSEAIALWCWFNAQGSAFYGTYQEAFSKLKVDTCFYGDGNANGSWTTSAKLDVWHSKYYNATPGNGRIGPRATQLSSVALQRGTVIDNFDNTSGGCLADQNSVLVFYSGSADGKNKVRNCGTYGMGATTGSGIRFNQTNYVDYSGNGTNTYADAASYAFKDY